MMQDMLGEYWQLHAKNTSHESQSESLFMDLKENE